MNTWTLIIALAGALWMSTAADAQETSRSNNANTRRAHRQTIKSMHILDRPYRPGHFYGNTVRRRYYRGTSQRPRFRTR
ncbi:MAG: hypothetical protein H8E44_30750 [Planctomycetes bacterium]|nr:hypothetical protein [Planctomycetota bacterium]MBL7039988.1 hypothetical protein [Pirellulaceae bacterium]